MSIGNEIAGERPHIGLNLGARGASFPYEPIPYLVSSIDALVVLAASLFGAVFYHWVSDTPLPDVAAYFALGLIASFIHIGRQGGRNYYDFERLSKPGVEAVEILICWFSTAFLLAFFAFLFKIGLSFSRGSFLVFIAAAPVGLLAVRKLEKSAVECAVARGAIGGRNVVLVGDQDELASLEDRDLLAMLGGGKSIASRSRRSPITLSSDPKI